MNDILMSGHCSQNFDNNMCLKNFMFSTVAMTPPYLEDVADLFPANIPTNLLDDDMFSDSFFFGENSSVENPSKIFEQFRFT